jgi:hypothetical protein
MARLSCKCYSDWCACVPSLNLAAHHSSEICEDILQLPPSTIRQLQLYSLKNCWNKFRTKAHVSLELDLVIIKLWLFPTFLLGLLTLCMASALAFRLSHKCRKHILIRFALVQDSACFGYPEAYIVDEWYRKTLQIICSLSYLFILVPI